jgi:5-methylcytosine-specific restriction endonuclease McrA
MAARTALHSKKNPELVAARVERRKKVEAAAAGSYTAADIEVIRNRLNDECYYCGVRLNGGGDVDHMLSLNKGGTHWPANLTLACKTCNLDKHSKSAPEFFQWRKERKLSVRAESLLQPAQSKKWRKV